MESPSRSCSRNERIIAALGQPAVRHRVSRRPPGRAPCRNRAQRAATVARRLALVPRGYRPCLPFVRWLARTARRSMQKGAPPLTWTKTAVAAMVLMIPAVALAQTVQAQPPTPYVLRGDLAEIKNAGF